LKSVQHSLGLQDGQDCCEELVASLRSKSEGHLRRATLYVLAQFEEQARPFLTEIGDRDRESIASFAPPAPGAQSALNGWPKKEGQVRSAAEVPRDDAPRLRKWSGTEGFSGLSFAHLRWDECLDFDTGRVFRLPDHVELAGTWEKTAAWMRESGCDVIEGRLLAWCDMTRFPAVKTYGPLRIDRAETTVEVSRFVTREGTHGVACAMRSRPGKSNFSTRIHYALAREGVQWDAKEWQPTAVEEDHTDWGSPPPHLAQIREIQVAVLEYALDHGNEWPNTLEQVLDGKYLDVSDREVFLNRYEYVRPWITLEQLKALRLPSYWNGRPDYETAIVVNDREAQ
jgi:hypothetical protein